MANFERATPSDGSDDPGWPPDSGLEDQYEDLPRLLQRSLSRLAGTVLDALRRQPYVAATIVAVGIGILVGVRLAERRPGPAAARELVEERVEAAGRGARRAGRGARAAARWVEYRELASLVRQLLDNPIVRGYVFRALGQMFARRFR